MKLQDLRQYFRDGQVSLMRKGLVVFAGLYAVMPFDLVFDGIPVLGLLDDAGVIAAVAAFLWRDVKKHAAARLASSNPAR